MFADERSFTLPLLGPANNSDSFAVLLLGCFGVRRGNAVHATRTHIDIAAHLCALKRCGGRTAVRLVHSRRVRERQSVRVSVRVCVRAPVLVCVVCICCGRRHIYQKSMFGLTVTQAFGL